jgi:ketosteroid isomerase-like protein
MKKLLLLITLGLALCFTFSCQKGEEVAEELVVDVEAEVQTLTKIEEEWGAAIAAGNFEKVLSFYADNAILMPPNQALLIGKESIREFMQTQPDQFIMEYSGTTEDVQVSGDLAFTRGTQTQTLIPKSGGDTLTAKGNWLCIYRIQPDGTWKCIINTWTDESLISPLEPPTE